LPFPDADRLVELGESHPPEFPHFAVRPMTFPHWKAQATSFEGLAVVRDGSYNLTGLGDPLRVYAGKTTANVFPTLRVAPALGRAFTVEEETPGKDDVVILSHGFWQRQLGGRPDVLAQTLRLDGRSRRVVGVMPPGFRLDGDFDLYVPDSYLKFRQDESDNRTIEVFARLRPGVTVAAARSELTLIQGRIAAEDDSFEDWLPEVTPMLAAKVGGVSRTLWALLGAVGFLLLIACANVASLCLARATARGRELAVRAALGAGRGRLVRQLLAESLLLAAIGALLGVLVARWGLSALLALAPEDLPRLQEIAVDARAIAVATGLALLTGIAFGLAPAFRATGVVLHDPLKDGARGARARPQRLRGALVVAEIAVALVLLAGAGLLMRTFARLQAVGRGFDPRDAVTMTVTVPQEKYATAARMATFADETVRRLAALPGVRAAGAVQDLPFRGGLNVVCLHIPGRPLPRDCPPVRIYSVTPGYFAAMGIPLVRGRLYEQRDWSRPTHPAVVNEALARKYFPGQDPIGQYVTAKHRPDDRHQIIGVVGDVRDDGLAGEVGAQAYPIFSENPAHTMTFVVRGGAPPLASLRAALAQVDPEQPIARVRPLSSLVAASIARERFAATLFAVFSIVALALAAIGIYGLISYAVVLRTRELGIRIALGAQVGDVLGLVLRQGARLLAAGLVLGATGAFLLTRFLASLLFDIGPRDPSTFAVTAAALALVGAIACLLPARRATCVDPMIGLRSE
jgi:predicted permease